MLRTPAWCPLLRTLLGSAAAAVLSALPATAQCAPPATGVTSIWDGDAVSGTTAPDALGRNHAAIFGGAVLNPIAPLGTSFVFDGQDDYLGVGARALGTTGSFSIEAWIYAYSVGQRDMGIVSEIANSAAGFREGEFTFRVERPGFLGLTRRTGVSNRTQMIVAPTPFPVGAWVHVAAVYDAALGQLSIYQNGGSAGGVQVAADYTGSQPSNHTTIGSGEATAHRFHGEIDQVAIYHRALCAAEIESSHRAGAAGTPMCATFRNYPGSSADFRLLTGVNGPADIVDVKPIFGGNTLTIAMDSPGGTFHGATAFLSLQPFLTGTPPGGSPGIRYFEDYQLDLFTAAPLSVLFDAWIVPALSPGGNSASLPFPYYDASGLSLMLQAGVVSTAAPNGLLAFSDAHELQLIPSRFYVDGVRGDDGNGGTAQAPLRTIQRAIDLVGCLQTAGSYPSIKVAFGLYLEDLALGYPIHVDGGLDPNTWARVAGQYSTVALSHRGFRVRNIQSATTISGFDFQAANGVAPAANGPFNSNMASIAIQVARSNNEMTFTDCIFRAGSGANAAQGRDQTQVGTPGNSGGPGGTGFYTLLVPNYIEGGNAGSGASGWNGGRGGNGGGTYCTFWLGSACLTAGVTAGDAGASGVGCNNSVSGGAPATCGAAANGSPGALGIAGVDGRNGVPPAGTSGYAPGGEWLPRVSEGGQSGNPGCGGSGGGGGGGFICLQQPAVGGGGGGGGGAGGGGLPGGGGVQGGASIACFLYDASPTFLSCQFVSSAAGNAGRGGNGSRGGTGGSGGPGGNGFLGVIQGVTLTSGAGGVGGIGGMGGGGGGGAGGHGGPSFGVFLAGISAPPALQSPSSFNTFQPGTGGSGGSGGVQGGTANSAGSGSAGPSDDIGS